MANNRDTFVSEIYVNNEQANDAIAEMTKQLTKLTDKYDDLVAKNEKLTEKTDKAKAAIDATGKAWKDWRKIPMHTSRLQRNSKSRKRHTTI